MRTSAKFQIIKRVFAAILPLFIFLTALPLSANEGAMMMRITPPWLGSTRETLSLAECLKGVSGNSEEVLAARSEKDARSFELSAVKREYLPKFSANADGGYDIKAGDPVFTASVGADLPLFWGAINADRRLAKNRFEQSRLTARQAVKDSRLEITEAYYELFNSERAVKIMGDSMARLRDQRKAVAALADAGRALRSDIFKLDAELSFAKLRYSSAVETRNENQRLLADLLKQSPGKNFTLKDEPYVPFALSYEETLALAETESPAWEMTRLKRKQIEEEIKREKWAPFHGIQLSSRVQHQEASYVQPADENQVIVGVRAGLDIWDWGRHRNRLKAKKADARADQIRLGREEKRLKTKLRNNYENLLYDDYRVQSAWQSVLSMQKEFDAEQVRFEHGLLRLQDFLTAQLYLDKAKLSYERARADRQITKAKLVAFLGVSDSAFYENRREDLSDEAFMELLMRRAFLYFEKEYEPASGLFFDADGGGDSSTAATGFGLSALVIGAERGWMPKEEARARTLQALKTLLWLQKKGFTYQGFFYHFMDPLTGERAGKSEVSIIDTALLLTGVLTAAEYFDGEVRALSEEIYGNIKWKAFLPKSKKHRNSFYLAWSPERGFFNYYWDVYTDETLLIVLLALGSSDSKLPKDLYQGFRKEKKIYGSTEFYPSWSGSLFTYQYANLFFDFKHHNDPNGINWFQNSVTAAQAQIDYLQTIKHESKAFERGFWGVSSGELPSGDYNMMLGVQPNLAGIDNLRGILVPTSVAGSMEFVPEEALKTLRQMFLELPQAWGRYGFTSSFDLDQNWFSSKFYALDQGVLLIGLDNYLSGTVRNHFMKNKFVREGLSRAGFAPVVSKSQPKEFGYANG